MKDLPDLPTINQMIPRRTFLKAAPMGVAAIAAPTVVSSTAVTQTAHAATQQPYFPAPNDARFVFRVEKADINPDGKKVVSGVTLNGQYPAPEIRVKQGEMFRAQLENHLVDEATSVHWHGLLLPAGMDGVPDVSNEAIKPRQVYVFEYPLLQSGTYWYHSHSGLQEQIGFAGAYIIEPLHETLAYDHDCVVLLTDWLYRSPYDVFDELKKGEPAEQGGDSGSQSGMQMDKPDLSDVAYDAFLMNGKGNANPWSCKANPGDRVRLRVIGAGASTFFKFMVDGHRLTVTHADGPAVQPVEVDHLLVGMGETYDVVVTVRGSGSYTIRAMALDGSGQTIGVLHTPDVTPKADLSKPVWGRKALAYTDLRSAEPTALADAPVREISMELMGNMAKYEWSIDGQLYPKADPYTIRQGERVRVRMKNKTMMWHPMHLHGHFFRVMSPGADANLLPLKHTVNIAPKGTLDFEFLADNPGKWIFHCHNLYHLDAGMARVFVYQV